MSLIKIILFVTFVIGLLWLTGELVIDMFLSPLRFGHPFFSTLSARKREALCRELFLITLFIHGKVCCSTARTADATC